MTGSQDVTDPAVQALIAAINAGDREAFFGALAPGATMSDDGTDRDLASWADREIFTVHGHMAGRVRGRRGPVPDRGIPQRHLG